MQSDDVVIKLQELLNNKKLQKEMILNQKKYINQDSSKDLVLYIIKNFQ